MRDYSPSELSVSLQVSQAEQLAGQVVEAVKLYVGRASTEFASKLQAIDSRLSANIAHIVNDVHTQRMGLDAQQVLILTLEERIKEIPSGPQGEPGQQGEKGEAGPPGTDGKDGRDGIDGRDGVDGKDGVRGENGADAVVDYGLIQDNLEKSFVFPKGDKGDPGEKGDKGEKGDPGEPAPVEEEEDPEIVQLLLTGIMRKALQMPNGKEFNNGGR